MKDCLSEVIQDLKTRQLAGHKIDLAWAKGWTKRCGSKGFEILALYEAVSLSSQVVNSNVANKSAVERSGFSFGKLVLSFGSAFAIGALLVAMFLWTDRIDYKLITTGGIAAVVILLIAKRFLGLQLIAAGLGMLAWGHFDWEIWYPDEKNPVFRFSTYRSPLVHCISLVIGAWLIWFGVKQIRK